MTELMVSIGRFEQIDRFDNADAFLIGNQQTAVRIAGDFGFESMHEVINKIHNMKKKIYLNFSKIFIESELEELAVNFAKIVPMDFDGIFFSDFAIYQLAKQYNILYKLWYASETQIVNANDIAILKTLQINHFIVSKEMTHDNILISAQQHPQHLGALVFGHYSMFYSKRKLIGNFVEQYSLSSFDYLNRFDLTIQEKTREGKLPIIQNQNGSVIFSSDVLCAIAEIPSWIQQGIHTLWVDSIFLSDETIVSVLSLCRKAIKEGIIYPLQQVETFCHIQNLSTGFLYKKIGLK